MGFFGGFGKRCLTSLCATFLLFSSLSLAAENSGQIRVAFGDVPQIDLLNVLAALERVRARGIDIEVSYLQSEDIAAQAVMAGQADVGVGTPYGLIQESKAPVRLFYQLSTLRFYPVVNTRYYKTWADLDGVNMYTHSRGSGTEAIMNLMAKKHGIEYKSMTYLPGSGVRAAAMMQGRIRASIVDSERARLLMEEGSGQFALLPMPEIYASDEALYGNLEFLQQNADAVDVLLEELLLVWREVNQNPERIVDLRRQFDLMPNLPEGEAARILPAFRGSVESNSFPANGGGEQAVRADFEFYASAGSIQGDAGQLEIEDYWYLEPLNRALEKLGRQ